MKGWGRKGLRASWAGRVRTLRANCTSTGHGPALLCMTQHIGVLKSSSGTAVPLFRTWLHEAVGSAAVRLFRTWLRGAVDGAGVRLIQTWLREAVGGAAVRLFRTLLRGAVGGAGVRLIQAVSSAAGAA